jgi:hypothetical protein
MKKITLNFLLPILAASFLAACSSPAADEATKNSNTSSPSAELKRPEQPAAAASSAQPAQTPTTPAPQFSPATPAASPASGPTQPASATALPKLVIPVQKIDFGRQPKAKSLTKSILIKNVGKADLNIESVQPSCGCTTVETPPKVVAPGKTATIKLKIDTGQAPGSHTKSVTIKTNDPVQPVAQVDLTFTVK